MDAVRNAAAVVLLVVVIGGAAAISTTQAEVARTVAAYHDDNNEIAEGAPQQTVVGTWSTREAVIGLSKVLISVGIFLGVCIGVSSALVIMALSAIHKSLTQGAQEQQPTPAISTPVGLDPL